MGLKDKFKERMDRGKKRYREGQERRSDEAYLRDIDELRKLQAEEKRLGVKLKVRRTRQRIGTIRGETSPVRRWGGKVAKFVTEDPKRKKPTKKRATKKKRTQRKPRAQSQKREVRRDAFGVPL